MQLNVMWSLLILSLVTATIATSGSGQSERRARTRSGYSEKIYIGQVTTIGENKPIPPNLIPRKERVSSTSVETWRKGDILNMEIYGEHVFMSEVQELIEASKLEGDAKTPNNHYFGLTVRADTFYCDRKSDDIKDDYSLSNFKTIRFLTRRTVSNNCHIRLKMPGLDTPPKPIANGNDSSTCGKAGEDGKDGNNGVNATSTSITFAYLDAAGKIKITGFGGTGRPGADGSNGRNGFQGKMGSNGNSSFKCIMFATIHGKRGGDGSDGGDGGKGGRGGDGGNGTYVLLVTPRQQLSKMTFELQGNGGIGGTGGFGGKGGKGGKRGIGGESYRYLPKSFGGNSKCSTKVLKEEDGNPGNNGENGEPGKFGDNGLPGIFQKLSLGYRFFDSATWELILRKADRYYIRSKLTDAKKLYGKVREFGYPGRAPHKYASLMLKRIEAGLTYYGFSTDVVFAEDIEMSKDDVEKSLKFVQDEDERIDKMLYRRHQDNLQDINFNGLTNAIVANNDGLKKENELFVEIQQDQRQKILKGIGDIESDIRLVQRDFKHKLEAAVTRLRLETVIPFMELGLLFVKPDVGKIANIFSKGVSIARDMKTCSTSLFSSIFEKMQKRAMEYSKFRNFKVDIMKVFDLTPSIFTEMRKANSKSEIDKMKVALFCLIGKTGKVGKALEANLEVYLNYATARLSLIGKIYDIDLKMAEHIIKLQMLEKRNKVINAIKQRRKFRSKQLTAIAKVRLTEDLIDTFKETERYALQLLYIYTDSLRFETLWDFSECMKYYNPTKSIRANHQTYFDGYRAFQDLLKRIVKFHQRWFKTVGSPQEGTKWAFEINEDNDRQFIENLRKYKSAIFYFNASRLCDRQCSNFRLTKVRAEVTMRSSINSKYNPTGGFMITLEHLGDNHFYTGSRHEEPMILRQNKVEKFDLSSDTNNPLIKPCPSCGANAREIFNLPDSAMKKACKAKPKSGSREKRSTVKYYIPCRSPFARYKVKIPISTLDKTTPQENSARTDVSKIKGITFVFEVSYFKEYSKGPKGCPKM